MDRVNHLWPDIAALTPRVGLAWCCACECTAPKRATLVGSSWAIRRCRALGHPQHVQKSYPVAFLNAMFALELQDVQHALRWAAENGHVAVLQFLVNMCDSTAAAQPGSLPRALGSETSLTRPGTAKKADTLCLTLRDVRSNNNYALRVAAEKGHVAVLQFLKNTWDLTLQDVRSDYNFALRVAVGKGHVDVLQFLKNTWDLTLQDVRAETNCALRWAAGGGHVNTLQFLKNTWDLTLQDVRSDDNDALREAAYNGHVHVLQFLKNTWDLTLQDVRADYNYALRWAAANGHVDVLQFLTNTWDLTLQDVRSCDNFALRWAAANDHVDVLQFLKNTWDLTLQDVRSKDNYPRWSSYSGQVSQFLEEWLASFHD